MRDRLVLMVFLLGAAGTITFGAGLDLRAQEFLGNLQLTWDPVAANHAEAGTLSVEDGDFQRLIPLSVDHLRQGNLMYAPQRGHVIFRLKVGAVTETVEVVGSSRVDLQACKLEYSIVSPK